MTASVEQSTSGTTYRGVLVTLGVNAFQALALGVAAVVTGSVALRAQTATNAADVAVAVFLLVGVLSSARPADDSHPLGYGRERFFWSLFAALGIFVGGGGLALQGAVHAALHPTPVTQYALAYTVLAASFALDVYALAVGARPLRKRAASRGISLRTLLRRSTDPASTTVVVTTGCAVIGAVVSAVGLVASALTGSPTPDTVAGALIGVLLLVASVLLLRTNRELLSGRGVGAQMLHEMHAIIAAQDGVVDVPDVFAVILGPSSLIVDGDVTFVDELDVPAVEQALVRCSAALQGRWPSIQYVYLTPVARARAGPRASRRQE